MKLFNHLLTALIATSLWAGCTGETEEGGGNAPLPDDGENTFPRQEVMLTLDNKLIPGNGSTTRADNDPIATEAENAIDALDVFVFGSQSENGTYSYLERFAYRSDKDRMPAGATELELNAVDDKVNVVFNLKKGFFVRLYCVTNQETLIDPAHPDGTPFEATDYVPINYTVTDDGTMTVLAEGTPTEDAFKTFHTPLIDPTAAADVLLPALPMSGGLITPLDLRDHKSSGRLSAGFRLTRSVARFDVRNNPELTRLTIESVSMANGRKGVTLFPLQVYGDRPTAAAGDLVTYPGRPFTAEDDININHQTGAFYSYPCLVDDEASLLIKGKYQINQTESKEVVYTIPFQQVLGNDRTSTAWIEIQTNHRYTVSILDADEYNLQFSLSVADWNDEGSIDDYEPDNTPGDLAVNIPDAATDLVTYNADTKTVSMDSEAGSSFSIVLKTNSALQVTTSFQGNIPDCNWLTISDPEVKPAVVNDKYTNEYTYTVSPNADYAGNRFPRAAFRFRDLATGNEQILFVKLTGMLVLTEMAEAQWPEAIPAASKINKFDVDTQTASLFLIENSQVPFSVVSSDEVAVDESSLPEYLEVALLSKEGDEAVYALKLKTTEIADIPEDGVTVILINKNKPTRKQTITVKLLDASVEPTFASLGGTNVEHTPGSGATPDNVTIPLVADNAFTISTTSVDGVDVNIDYNHGSLWLTSSVVPSTRAVAKEHKTDIKFSLVEGSLPGAKPVTVTLTNKVKGGDYKFTVTPKADKPVLTKADTPSVPVDDAVAADGSITMYKLPSTSSTLAVKVAYLGGSKLSCSDASLVSIDKAAIISSNEGVYTLTALKTGSATLTVTSAIDETQTTNFTIQVLDPAITVPSGNVSLNLVKDATSTKASITSPAGFTAADADINWGSGGSAWFTLTTTNVNKDGSIGVKTKDLLSVSPNNVKSATVTLKNKIAGGPSATFKVDPVWMAPTANTSNASALNVMCYKQGTFTVNIPFGGIASASSANTSYATVTTNTGNGVVTYTGKYYSVTGASQSVNITVANAKDANKKITYTINVQNLNWATGNLVANGANGAKIGASTDYGLLFRWGSLIGYDTSTAGNATAVVTPSGYSGGKPTFTNSPSTGDPNSAVNVSAGTGDPCKHYLGGKWRMPTADEYRQMGGNVSGNQTFNPWEWTAVSGVNGVKTGPNKALFFPAAGGRDFLNGSLNLQGTVVFAWSSSPNISTSGCILRGSQGNAYMDSDHHSYGFAVRCVQEP